MRYPTLPLVLLAALCGAAAPTFASTRALDGLVTQAGGTGLHDVSIFAYEVARAQVRQAATDPRGHFSFPELPPGLYKLVAFKKGFAPAIAVLSRAADQGLQFVELELETETSRARDGNDYWSLRDALPGDVLRSIERTLLEEAIGPLPALRLQLAGSIRAETGVEASAKSQSHVAGASIDLAGRVGGLDIGLDGRFRQLEGPTGAAQNPSQMAVLGLEVSHEGAGTLRYDARRERLELPQLSSSDGIELARHRVAWTHDSGANRSAIAAEYVDRGQLYLASGLSQLALPFAERSWRLEGSWERELDDWGGVATKLRYIEHQVADSGQSGSDASIARTLEASGEGGWHATPTLLVEYGLFARLGDGSLSLAPRGSMVIQISDRWQSRFSASGRVVDEQSDPLAWGAALTSSEWSGGQDCVGFDQRCLRFGLVRQSGPDSSFELVAMSREVAELVRVTFDDGFVDGLLLLPGDEIPELSLSARRRLGDQVTARLDAAVGEGGGGQLPNLPGVENHVRYRVTSLETQFEATETGVFVAVHHLAQGIGLGEPGLPEESELRRVQLRVTQNLDGLLRLASSWAVHLGMELSKGRLPFSPAEANADAQRRRLTGGVAVRF